MAWLYSLAAWPQSSPQLILHSQVPISSTPVSLSVDKNDFVYIGFEDGVITKYDSVGKVQLVFSPQRLGAISLVEAWPTMLVFVFYKELQNCLFLDRFLNEQSAYAIDPNMVGFARIATLAQDGSSIWLMDEVDFSLKKYAKNTNQPMVNTALDLLLDPTGYNIVWMREYQNLVFLHDVNSGVLIFDNLGNFKKKVELKNTNFVGIRNEELYYLEGNFLKTIHLYNAQQRQWEFSIPIKGVLQAALLEKHLLVTTSKAIHIFSLR
ncbi:MAG TPA: hypothetical protein DCM08_13775 [Microscillaceae bacterium]|nr:hypothetical protein [Microscillaceae bacterium]